MTRTTQKLYLISTVRCSIQRPTRIFPIPSNPVPLTEQHPSQTCYWEGQGSTDLIGAAMWWLGIRATEFKPFSICSHLGENRKFKKNKKNKNLLPPGRKWSFKICFQIFQTVSIKFVRLESYKLSNSHFCALPAEPLCRGLLEKTHPAEKKLLWDTYKRN